MTNNHNQIICPKCHSAFPIDKSDYALISHQIRTKEFNSELEKKVQSELTKSMKMKGNELDHKYQKQILEKVNLITQLRNDIKLQEEQHKNDKKQNNEALEKKISNLEKIIELNDSQSQLNIEKATKEKVEKISKLENDLKLLAANHEIVLNNSLETKDKVITKLNKENDQIKADKKIAELELKQKYTLENTLLKDEIERLKNHQPSLTKEIGEDFEQYFVDQFNSLKQVAFPNTTFEKDNILIDGTKGDFILKYCDEEGDHVTSIMFEMKFEKDGTKSKRKYKKFFEKLDKDRIKKGCEYAVLMGNLEKDSDFYNEGICEIFDYRNLYVCRPQHFKQIIRWIIKLSRKSLRDKRELQIAKQNNIKNDIISANMNIFREGLLPQLELVYSNRPKFLEYIDESIKSLSKLRALYITDTNNIESAKNKLSQFRFENMVNCTNILEPNKTSNKNF
tara:strand:+ start:547 stop:1902 length:1356 start_codon:yes stop_codon:yes gene_type:complete